MRGSVLPSRGPISLLIVTSHSSRLPLSTHWREIRKNVTNIARPSKSIKPNPTPLTTAAVSPKMNPPKLTRNNQFFAQLNELFTRRKGKDHGAIHLSQKRCMFPPYTSNAQVKLFPADAYGQPTFPSSDWADEPTLSASPIIIRATNAKGAEKREEKVRLTTLVEPGELDAFYVRYAEACKTGMAALKPRDRTKRKTKAKKKKGGV